MTLALVRHGRTPWNHERRMQGRSDIALDEHGRRQADAAGRELARRPWERVVSSPLSRAVESAALIAAHLPGVPVSVDSDLIERDYGAAEGLTVAEAYEQWPSHDYPGAESESEVASRAVGALGALLAASDTVVVAHGTLLRIGVQSLTGATCSRILNGEVLLLHQNPAGTITVTRR